MCNCMTCFTDQIFHNSLYHFVGPYTLEDVLTVTPFRNLVEQVELYGRVILQMLEHSVSRYDPTEPQGAFLQVSGI